jgi:Glyoxalase-like domain
MAARSFVLSLLGFAYGVMAHAASPEPRASAAGVDHLILGTRDLDEGIRQFEERTGVRPVFGGEHPGRGTRNALVSLGDRHYIEILAPQVSAADSDRVRPLRAMADLTPMGWAVSVRDLDAARQRLGAAGFTLSEVMPGSRAKPDGRLLEWKTFEIGKPQIEGVPFFIRWGDRTTHPSLDSPAGCRLERLRVVTPAADDLRRAFSALSLEMAVDTGAHGGLDITLRCPKGTVQFRGDVVPR